MGFVAATINGVGGSNVHDNLLKKIPIGTSVPNTDLSGSFLNLSII